MSILNVNQIQPVGGGNTITVSASDISASGATITATSFVGSVTGTTSNASGATGDFSIADKIIHTGDTNTAIRFPAADTFTVETTGNERLRINSSGLVGINTTTIERNLVVSGGAAEGVIQITNNTSGGSQANGFELIHFTSGETQLLNRENGAMRFDTNGTERLRITSNGDIEFGDENNKGIYLNDHSNGDRKKTLITTSDYGNYNRKKLLFCLENTQDYSNADSSDVRMTIQPNGHVGIGTDNPTKILHLSQNSDVAIRMHAENANANARSWEIVVGGNASNNAEMVFRTRQDDGTGGSECARIKRNGIIALPSGGGIDFSATANSSGSMASEVLDDYEEGTFDPTIAPTSGSITLNSSFNTLSYTKIGRLVHISGQIRISSVNSPGGNTSITNLPFTAQSTTEQGRAGANCFYFDASAGSGNYYKAVPIHVTEGTTTLKILNLHALGGLNPAASDELAFAFSYIAAS